MNVRRRLVRLEGHAALHKKSEVPMEVRLLLRAVERHQARERGDPPPAYTQEELEQMHRDDLAEAAGGGVVGLLRDSAGWQGPEAQRTLDTWEEAAKWRVEQTKNLPPERWGEVYELAEDA